ncbi:antigen like protein, partial [Clarias magur]
KLHAVLQTLTMANYFFFYICLIWITICVGLLSAVPNFTVSERVGSTAVLPCELKNVHTETPYIKWSIKSKSVLEREGEDSYQGEGYKGRVDVPVEKLNKGNCSLLLENLRLNDTGVYTSFLAVTDINSGHLVPLSHVNLSVHARS